MMQRLFKNKQPDAKKNEDGETSLLMAAKNGHLETVQWLLKNGASLAEKDNQGNTALLQAALSGQLKTVQWFLENGADFLETNNAGETALDLAVGKTKEFLQAYVIEKQKGVDTFTLSPELFLSSSFRSTSSQPIFDKKEPSAKGDDHGETSLLEAAKNGSLGAVQRLFKKGAVLSKKDKYGNTALLFAAFKGHLKAVQWLLKNGATLSEKTNDGHTALLNAASNGKLETVQWLLKNGATLSEKTNNGHTALLMAAWNGHLETVQWLLKNGAALSEKNDYGEGALLVAARNGKLATVQWLLKNGATLSEKTNNGHTALLMAAWNGHLETVQWLLKNGATLSEKTNDGNTALLMAAWNGQLETVQWLLKNGAALSEKTNNGNTALLLAASNGHLATVQWLLKNGAALSEKTNNGHTALLMAAWNGHLETVQWLLKNGATLSEKTNNGNTALLNAAWNGHLETVQWLLKNGAALSEKTNNGNTALLMAAWNGHLETVQWLLKNGATLSEKTKYGHTALLLAASNGHLATVQWLLKNGAALSQKDKYGNTALLMAAWNGHLETVQWLLKNGAALSEKNNNGSTALLLAAEKGHLDTVQWLLENGASLTEKNKAGKAALDLASGKTKEFLQAYAAEQKSENIPTASRPSFLARSRGIFSQSILDKKEKVSAAVTAPSSVSAPASSSFSSSADLSPEEFNQWRTVFPDMKLALTELRREAKALSSEQFNFLLGHIAEVAPKIETLEQHLIVLDRELDRDPVARAEREKITQDPLLFAYYKTARKLHYHFLAAKVITSGSVAPSDDAIDLMIKGASSLGQSIPGIKLLVIALEKSILFGRGISKHRAMCCLADWVQDTTAGDRLAERFARCAALEKAQAIHSPQSSLPQRPHQTWVEKLYAGGKAIYTRAGKAKEKVSQAYRELKEDKCYTPSEQLALADTVQVLEAIMTKRIKPSPLLGEDQLNDHLIQMLSILGLTLPSPQPQLPSSLTLSPPMRPPSVTFSPTVPPSHSSSLSPLSPVSTASSDQVSALEAEVIRLKQEAERAKAQAEKEKKEAETLRAEKERQEAEKAAREAERDALLERTLTELAAQKEKTQRLERESKLHKENIHKLASPDREVDVSGRDSLQIQMVRSAQSPGNFFGGAFSTLFVHRELAEHHARLAVVEQILQQQMEDLPLEKRCRLEAEDLRSRRRLFSTDDDSPSPPHGPSTGPSTALSLSNGAAFSTAKAGLSVSDQLSLRSIGGFWSQTASASSSSSMGPLKKNRQGRGKGRPGLQPLGSSLAKEEKAPKSLTGSHLGITFTFEEMQIATDGDCGFSALQITRDELVTALRTRSSSPESRQALAPEIEEFLRTRSRETMRDLRNDLGEIGRKTDVALLSQTRKALLAGGTFVVSKELFEAYLSVYRIEKIESKLYLGYCAALLYAKYRFENPINLYIWRAPPTGSRVLTCINHYSKEGDIEGHQTIHMVHTANYTHYNVLKVMGKAAYSVIQPTNPPLHSRNAAMTSATLSAPSLARSSTATTPTSDEQPMETTAATAAPLLVSHSSHHRFTATIGSFTTSPSDPAAAVTSAGSSRPFSTRHSGSSTS